MQSQREEGHADSASKQQAWKSASSAYPEELTCFSRPDHSVLNAEHVGVEFRKSLLGGGWFSRGWGGAVRRAFLPLNYMYISDTVWVLWPLHSLHCGSKETAERHRCFNCLQLIRTVFQRPRVTLEGKRNLAETLLTCFSLPRDCLKKRSEVILEGERAIDRLCRRRSRHVSPWLGCQYHITKSWFVLPRHLSVRGFCCFSATHAPMGECSCCDVLVRSGPCTLHNVSSL